MGIDTPLRFGTAGVRAPMGDGPDRLNTTTVEAIAAGVASWLPPRASVLIGYDARRHSDEFAAIVGEAFEARGVRAVLAGRVPTPVLAFATRRADYSAGVMVTASHNPASDNGIKVYDGTGAQIDVAQAAEIEAAIAAPRAALPPSARSRRTLDPVPAYLDALPEVEPGTLRIAYTPLHGVGGDVFTQALRRNGFDDVHVVAAQAEPDPEFPTAPFPNPEEPGVLDLLVALGIRVGADIGIAHDPDADRLAVVAGDRVLTGDEVGLLLADEVLRRSPGPVATTLVSADALGVLAVRRGVPYEQTLTGFKHLVRAHGGDLAFAYEEALGYAVAPRIVRDKDGISAGLLVAAMAAADRRAGRTLLDRLTALETELGVEVATAQIVSRVGDPAATIAALRAAAPPGFAVHREEPFTVIDGDGDRIIVRGSGTEPKLKTYLQARRRADLPRLNRVAADWLAAAAD